jgi:hypothetical protein
MTLTSLPEWVVILIAFDKIFKVFFFSTVLMSFIDILAVSLEGNLEENSRK